MKIRYNIYIEYTKNNPLDFTNVDLKIDFINSYKNTIMMTDVGKIKYEGLMDIYKKYIDGEEFSFGPVEKNGPWYITINNKIMNFIINCIDEEGNNRLHYTYHNDYAYIIFNELMNISKLISKNQEHPGIGSAEEYKIVSKELIDSKNCESLEEFEDFEKIENIEDFEKKEEFEDFEKIENIEDFEKIEDIDDVMKKYSDSDSKILYKSMF